MEERNEAIEVIENAANKELDRINEESNGGGIGKLIGIGVLAAGAIITGGVLLKKKLKKRKADKEAYEDLDDDYLEYEDFEEVEATEAEPEKEEKSKDENK